MILIVTYKIIFVYSQLNNIQEYTRDVKIELTYFHNGILSGAFYNLTNLFLMP